MKFADISVRAGDRQAHVLVERDADPIDLKRLSAQLRGEAMT
jgi:hypothetical protein